MAAHLRDLLGISIHAPHVGRDAVLMDGAFDAFAFQSTHPSRGATRLQRGEITGDQAFQSTRPVRGATASVEVMATKQEISIHAPHAGRDAFPSVRFVLRSISIHAPHAGRDGKPIKDIPQDVIFQSTRPMRGATLIGVN